MSTVLDLNLLPIQRHNGQDQSDFPGLFAATPPRRAARGRDQDNLVLYLTLQGSQTIAAEQQVRLLTRLAQTFYKTPGAVTSALRMLADVLNQSLLEGNLHNPGSQVIGLLTQMVVRGESVTLAHSGAGHGVALTPTETTDYTDETASGRGLGLSRTFVVRFFQFALHSNEFVLLTHQSAEDWQVEGLRISANQGMEGLRRRLLVGRSEPELNAVLLQALAGTGKLRFLRVKTPLPDMARPQPAEAAAARIRNAQGQAAPTEQAPTEQAPKEQAATEQAATTRAAPDEQMANPTAIGGLEPLQAGLAGALPPAASGIPDAAVQKEQAVGTGQAESLESVGEPAPKEQAAKEQTTAPAKQAAPDMRKSQTKAVRPIRAQSSLKPGKPSPISGGLKRTAATMIKILVAFLKAVSNALRQVGSGLLWFFRRVLPDENMLNISPKTLLFIAIGVPVLVSVVGGVVYLERGQAAQYQQYYDQAVQAAAQARVKTDAVEQRLAWQTTLGLLEKAEFYRLTAESQALRESAQTSLDALDGIERLDYQPALIGTLDKSINITKLVTVRGDLYMLNGAQGNVFRAVLTGGGYQIDNQFVCGPIAGGAAVVGPLMDIATLPNSDESKATIIGIDANGTSIYCIPGEAPLLQPITPPGVNFSEIRAMDVNLGDLYLFDPGLSAVWIYRGLRTVEPPRLFFGEEVPAVLDVVDMMVNNDDLYLLHADGHLALCAYEYNLSETMTRCEDPLNFVDLRQGRSGGPVIPDALFSQIQFAPPPDPSLYMLDPKSQAIYHFSLRLAFQRQFRPIIPLTASPASAFVISTSRMAFLAVGNRVYYAVLP